MPEQYNTGPVPLMAARVIFLALISGILLFVGVVFAFPLGRGDDLAVLNVALIGLAVVTIPMSFVLPGMISAKVAARAEAAAEELDHNKIPQEIFAGALVGAAVAEGLGLFGCVVALITGNRLALIGALVAVVLIALRIPTEESAREALRRAVERGA